MTLLDDDATPVPTSLLTVLLSARSARLWDAHALLLSDTGRVRDAWDVVFYNAPRHPSQAVTLAQDTEAGTARLSVSLPRTGADIQRILLAGSVQDGTLAELTDPALTVLDAAGPVARCDITPPVAVRAMVFGEFRRERDGWSFRPGGPGFAGPAELFTAFGATVGADRTPGHLRLTRSLPPPPGRTAPPNPERPDWHPDPAAGVRRWWDGQVWTDHTAPIVTADARTCTRCGQRRGWRPRSTPGPCRECAAIMDDFLDGWCARMWQVLSSDGPRDIAWAELWTELRFRHIDIERARRAAHGPGLAFVERTAAFAVADGEITAAGLADVDTAVTALALAGPQVDRVRNRLQRIRTLTRLRSGELPVIPTVLHLDPDEQVHLDIPATRVRQLARGPKTTAGQLICSSKKLRFVGSEAGVEWPWSRIVAVTPETDAVVVATTSARGGAEFTVEDPELVAATLEGALRVAKRLALVPGRRDSRAIAPEIKAEVWQRDGGRCVDCGASHYLEFDHVIPISRGGATSAGNLQILCRSCNRAKGARI